MGKRADLQTLNAYITLLEEARRLKAPAERLSEFLTYINSGYSMQWFHKVIADHCQLLLEDKIKNLMIFMPPQHGKAFDIYTPVLTRNRGWVNHGDLRRGDFVFAPNGHAVRVEAVTQSYEWECRTITFAHGEQLVASYNHEWGCYIPNSNHEPIYYANIETDDIMRKKRDRSPYLLCAKPLKYNSKHLAIPPYLLGLWLGDGASRHKQICSSADDTPHLLARYNGQIVHTCKNINYITFDELNCTRLREIGVLGDKHIPHAYKTASIKQRRELLQGLMDTDGTCDKRGNCEIVQKRERLSYDIFELISSLGYKPRMMKTDAKLYGRKVSDKYRILFNPNRNDNIFGLPRKTQRLRDKTKADRDDKFKHFIQSIEPCGKRVVNCIQVEGGYYLVGKDLRPTHNSEIVSRNFPAWALGKDPDLKIVGTSYSSDLATQFSRSIQRVIDTPEYAAVFPNTFLNGSNVRTIAKGYLRNVDIFECVGRKGFYKSVGVGGSLTGTPVDIAIIDDPVKDAIEAYSTTYRARVWEWYNSVLLTRLHNTSKQILIMTRWHEDDLAGRILERMGDRWTIIQFPAICEEENDGGMSNRHIGDPLWGERHSLEKLLQAKELAPSNFSALYQQHPVIEGGNIVKREWFQTINKEAFEAMHFREPIHFYLDTAYNKKKANADNDPSGILAACRIDKNIYILHAQEVWMEMPELLRFLPEYITTYHGNEESILHVEPKANGVSVIQMLKKLTDLNVKQTPNPTDSKETRLRAVTPRIECGRVYLVEGAWNVAFMDEVCGFPSRPHDEFVDILGYAINDLFKDDDDIDWDKLGNYNFF